MPASQVMTKTIFAGLLSFMLVSGFTGCDLFGSKEPVIEIFKGEDSSGQVYVLAIIDDEVYTFVVDGKTSTGTASKSDSVWTLTPADGGEPFTVTVSREGITAIDGTITFTDSNDPEAAPGEITPVPSTDTGNDDSAARTIIITGYPGEMEIPDQAVIFISPVDTDMETLNTENGIVALGSCVQEGSKATVQLKEFQNDEDWTDDPGWTGSGTYRVWLEAQNNLPGDAAAKWYKAANVSITKAKTAIAASRFVLGGGGVTGDTSGKKITITEITGKTGDVTVTLFTSFNDAGVAARGQGSVSEDALTVDLTTPEGEPWTETGSYYIRLDFAADNTEYNYHNGVLPEGALNRLDLPRYNITETISSIALDKFVLIE